MKKSLIFLTSILILLLTSCTTESYQATFKYGDDIDIVKTRRYGKKTRKPKDPVKRGHHFIGWTKDKDSNVVWDFKNDQQQFSF